MRPPSRKPAGLTLIEMAVLLVVLAIFVAALSPPALKLAAARKRNATLERMKGLHQALVGNPEHGHFGFLADLGELPPDLGHLAEAGNYPLFRMDNTGGLGMGWNGPYVQLSAEQAKVDAFGRPFAFGRTAPGQIQSAGEDGRFGTEDDIFYPPVPSAYFGTVHLEVVPGGAFSVRLYYSEGGRERYLQADSPPFVFEDIHLGPHAVQVFRRDEEGELTLVHERVVALTGRTGLFMLQF